MKKPFHDPISVKTEEPKSANPSVFGSKQVDYDERGSCYVKMGAKYGVGRTNPVGHGGAPLSKVASLPMEHSVRNLEID
jgi:hypothetical protein